MEKENIVTIATKILQELEELGLAVNSLYYNQNCLQTVCSHYISCGYSHYDDGISKSYIEDLDKKVSLGLQSKNHANGLKRANMMIERMSKGEPFEWFRRNSGSKLPLNKHFSDILEDFIEKQTLSSSTVSGMKSILRKYLHYLCEKGTEHISDIKTIDLAEYIITSELKSSSLHSLKIYVKKFYIYLYENHEIKIKFETIVSEPVVREIRIRPYTTSDELELILEQIDNSTPKGKRDYAILLLAAHTGLRSSDIINLKLDDIDWRKFELRIVQEKTKISLSLPLTASVGEAIKDYILNGRPQSTSKHIFLRTKAPYEKIATNVTLVHIIEKYQQKANISRNPYDGKGFHSLRRGLGRNMIIAGVPVTTIAQVLGHTNIESTKPYLPLDTQNLKNCALSFDGIEEGGR